MSKFATFGLLAMLILCAPALGADTQEPVPVKTLALEQALIYPEISAPATVVSLGNSRIGAELNARIQAIPVRVGDIVEPGGVLVRLDCGDYQLKMEEIQARLDGVEARIRFARQQLNRAQTLKKQRTVSQELVDQRESDLANLLAEREVNRTGLAITKRNLGKCTVTSPFKAVVLERLAQVGEYAMPGTPLIRVLDIADLEVSAKVIDQDAQTLAKAETIVLRDQARDYPLRLRTLTPVIDTRTRTREARLLFLAESALPGTTGRLVWTLGAALPADLLVRREQRIGVLLAQDDTAYFHAIPGAQEGRAAMAQLPADALIISEGRYGLQHGDSIRIMD